MRIVRVLGRLGIRGGALELSPGTGLVALLGEGRAIQAAQSLVMGAVVGINGHRRRVVRDAHVDVELDGSGAGSSPTRLSLGVGTGAEAAAARARLHAALGLDPGELALVWAGGLEREAAATVAGGAALLARRAGLDRIEAMLEALGRVHPDLEAPVREAGSGPSPPVAGAGAARLAGAERELRVLRADAAVVHGDLEEATMNWLRERQDAETTLMAYRDRARELKARLHQMETAGPDAPCPMCGRLLSDHYEEVATQLREEWESVVQDGRWWKRRREQLDPKPQGLQELESRSLRFQAAIEDATERAEHLRTELGVRAPAAQATPVPVPARLLDAAGEVGDPGAAAEGLGSAARELRQGARIALLSSTSKMLNRLSGGRLVGLEAPDGPEGPLVPRPVAGAPGTEDAAAAQVAAHLAVATTLQRMGVPVRSLLVGEPFSAMDEEDQIRAVAVLRRMARRVPQILVLPAAGVVEASPEVFDAVWEFRPEPEPGFPPLRSLSVGVGSVGVLTGAGRD